MPHVLIASDAPWVHEEVSASVPRGSTVRSLIAGRAVRAAVEEQTPDLVILDSQISSMGAFAVAYDLHNEHTGGRLPAVPVIVLLDRQADVFLARDAHVAGWLVKPLDPMRLRKAMTLVMAGGTYEDRSQTGDATTNYLPTPDATAR